MERFGQPSSSETISFTHVSLQIEELEQLDMFLDEPEAGITLALGPTSPVVRHNYLETIISQTDGEISLAAAINCIVDSETTFGREWQDDIFGELRGYYHQQDECKTFTLDHEPDALYIQTYLRPQTIRIKAEADTDSCSFYLTLIDNEFISRIKGESTDDGDIRSQPLDYKVLHDLATAWAKTQNIILANYTLDTAPGNFKHISVRLPDNFSSVELEIEGENQESNHPDKDMLAIENIGTAFDRIGGQFNAKERLIEIATIFSDPEGAASFDITAPSFILQGPPGTGKTSLVKAFAKASNAELMQVPMTDIQDKYIGESARNIRQKFQEAIEHDGRVVLFIDEIDALISNQNHHEFKNAAKIFGEIIEEAADMYPHVIIAGAMNAKTRDVIDSVIRSGRLEIITADTPKSYEELSDIWYTILYASESPFVDLPEEERCFSANINALELAKESNEFTGADITAILQHTKVKKFLACRATGHRSPVTQEDILREIAKFKQQRDSLND